MATKNDDNLKGAAAYILGFISGLALLILEKKSSYVRFHAAQSVVWFGFLFVLSIVLVLLSPIIWLVVLGSWFFLMWKAFNGEKYMLPYVGGLAEKLLKKI